MDYKITRLHGLVIHSPFLPGEARAVVAVGGRMVVQAGQRSGFGHGGRRVSPLLPSALGRGGHLGLLPQVLQVQQRGAWEREKQRAGVR